MIRKLVFWWHLPIGIVAGVFIFLMAATGVVLSFEKPATDFLDRDIRVVSVHQDTQPRALNHLLEAVRRAGGRRCDGAFRT